MTIRDETTSIATLKSMLAQAFEDGYSYPLKGRPQVPEAVTSAALNYATNVIKELSNDE